MRFLAKMIFHDGTYRTGFVHGTPRIGEHFRHHETGQKHRVNDIVHPLFSERSEAAMDVLNGKTPCVEIYLGTPFTEGNPHAGRVDTSAPDPKGWDGSIA